MPKITVSAVIAVSAVVAVAVAVSVLAPVRLLAEDWNTVAERGVAVSVYIETDENTDAIVRRQVTIMTGAESVTFDCLPGDIDCALFLLDSCQETETLTGFIDFINHEFVQETCLSGHGSCLYGKGFLFTNSSGKLQMIATTTTLQSAGSCSPH